MDCVPGGHRKEKNAGSQRVCICLGLWKALAVFFMFILLISQVRYYHLHFTHRETGLKTRVCLVM